MQKIISLIILLFIYFSSFSQEKRSKFLIKLGTEYRLTPIRSSMDNNNPTSSTIPFFSLDNQLSGASINYTFSYLFSSKVEIGFSQSFRYDHIYYEQSDLQPRTAFGKSINGMITNYHFFLGKYFKIVKTEFFLKGGFSLMNRGTNYSRSEFLGIDSQGISHFVSDELNFNFNAFNVNTGFMFDKYELGLGAYFINSTGANFENENSIVLPYIKLSYLLK